VQGAGLAGLGLLAGCGRLPGQAPQARVPRIGFLSNSSPGQSLLDQAFRNEMRELGEARSESGNRAGWASGAAAPYHLVATLR
jgi:hypothetical protein